MEYKGIQRATLLIALDNGGIHRGRSEKDQRRELHKWLARQPADFLPAIDEWLSLLSDDDLETVCAGEQSEAEALLAQAPVFTDSLLNAYFDEIC
jgi:hypothetical protein